MILTALWILYGALNVLSFSLYGVDKRRACRGAWRIPERTLLLSTWLMGGAGAWLGMKVFRHKTKHAVFCVSAPAATVMSIALMTLATLRLTNVI